MDGVAHGYVFDVASGARGPVEPEPLKAMGRFVHEAVAIDPRSGIAYETEDRRTSTGQRIGEVLPVTWVPIADPDPAAGGSQAVFIQGWEQGGAVFNRLEGAWCGDGSIFFISTNGGDRSPGPTGAPMGTGSS